MTFLPICLYADIGDCRYADIADIEKKCRYADIADINIGTPLKKTLYVGGLLSRGVTFGRGLTTQTIQYHYEFYLNTITVGLLSYF